MPDRLPLSERAQGRWLGILSTLGVSAEFLSPKHGPCPMCAGKDRWRWDNKDGRGTWICSRCGAGDGVKLLIALKGWDFRTAAEQIETVIGRCAVAPAPRGRSDDEKRAAMVRLWKSGWPITPSDPAGKWLRRRVGLTTFPPCLRYVESLRYPGEQPSRHPGMIAVVTSSDGKGVNIWRTYLTEDGRKAHVGEPRRAMEGRLPDGAAIRLADPAAVLGVAEGIETALAVTQLFRVPCWATTNTSVMAKWRPPEDVREVVVFADHDRNFAGLAAAYTLAHRIAVKDVRARVEIPPQLGDDWNDVLANKQEAA